MSSSNRKWWNDDELPPPSMRQKYVTNPLRQLSRSPNPRRRFFSPKSLRKIRSNQPEQQQLTSLNAQKKDGNIVTVEDLEERAKRLRSQSSHELPSVSDIEERLAKLRGVSVEEIRNPKNFVINLNERNEETIEKLMKKAKDEANIEAKWDRSAKSTGKQDIDPEKFVGGNKKSEIEWNMEPSTSGTDILMGQDTIRNLKDLRRTINLAKQQSMKAAALRSTGNDDKSMDDEMKKLMKLTRQSSMKSEKINEELSKFWEKRLVQEMPSSENSSEEGGSEHPSDMEISDEELQKVIMEAMQAENEVKEVVEESRKNTKKGGGIFSRIFRS